MSSLLSPRVVASTAAMPSDRAIDFTGEFCALDHAVLCRQETGADYQLHRRVSFVRMAKIVPKSWD